MSKSTQKRKTITRLLIYIVVGLITSVGVAWVAAVTVEIPYGLKTAQMYKTSQDNNGWEYARLRENLYVLHASSANLRIKRPGVIPYKKAPHWSRLCHKPIGGEQHTTMLYEKAWGWPMVCLVSEQRAYPLLAATGWTIISGIQITNIPSQLSFPNLLLPTRPIWFGLFVNTVMYSIIAWFISALNVKQRNSIRRKRGLCIQCRYNVRDLPACPECGNEVVTT